MIIIGKGSKLYQSIRRSDDHEFSTKEFLENNFEAHNNQTIIVFSLLDLNGIERIINNSNGIILIVGSCASISGFHNKFKYSKIKRNQLNVVKNNPLNRIKYLIFGEFYPKQKNGLTFFSDINSFWDNCNKASRSHQKVFDFYKVIGEETAISKFLLSFEKLGAPFTTFPIKFLTNYTYGYNNGAYISSKKEINILGSGMCAYAAKNVWKNSNCYSEKKFMPHKRIKSNWRPDPIISNKGIGGLSFHYHGVTPTSVINDKKNMEPLSILNLNERQAFTVTESYFVPRYTPRPRIKKLLDISEFKTQSKSEIIYLCLSVVGNLNYLINRDYIDQVDISDDIVYKIGSVSDKEVKDILSKNHITKKGAYFPILQIKNGHINFRPVFFKKTSINFIDIGKDFFKDLSPIVIIEKVLKAIYMRYGLIFLKPKYWECYIQQNIKGAYTIKKNAIIENDVKDIINDYIDAAHEKIISEGFNNFILDIGDFMSGIHLGYDRTILKTVPQKYRVFDTSLNDNPGSHPTILAFCKSYTMAQHDYKVIHNDL